MSNHETKSDLRPIGYESADAVPVSDTEAGLMVGFSFMEGWIRLHRKIRENWIWRDPVKFQWWVDILLEVNHKGSKIPIGFELIECGRGQSVRSLQGWAEKWHVSKDTARNFLKMLEKDGMILHESLSKTTRITVCNYDTYQTTLHDEQTMSKRLANDEQTMTDPNNNDNNENNDKNNSARAFSFQNNIFYSDLSELEAELLSSEQWIETVAQRHGLTVDETVQFVKMFVLDQKAKLETGRSLKEYRQHAVNWIGTHKPRDKKQAAKEFTYEQLIDMIHKNGVRQSDYELLPNKMWRKRV